MPATLSRPLCPQTCQPTTAFSSQGCHANRQGPLPAKSAVATSKESTSLLSHKCLSTIMPRRAEGRHKAGMPQQYTNKPVAQLQGLWDQTAACCLQRDGDRRGRPCWTALNNMLCSCRQCLTDMTDRPCQGARACCWIETAAQTPTEAKLSVCTDCSLCAKPCRRSQQQRCLALSVPGHKRVSCSGKRQQPPLPVR